MGKSAQYTLLEGMPLQGDLEKNLAFIKNMQAAVLLGLFEKGQLTKRQLSLCLEALGEVSQCNE